MVISRENLIKTIGPFWNYMELFENSFSEDIFLREILS